MRTYFSYEQYETFENDLITRVQEAHRHISYDFVVALPTGGVSLGVKASQTLGIPLHYAHATSYDAQGNKGDMHMEGIEAFLASLPPSPARILLIDDLSDSGDSFVFMKKLLEGRRYTVETAAIFAKKDTKHIPSFCLFPKFSGTWIVQPSEYREGPVAGHDVAGIKDHPVTQCIEIVVEKISAILDQYKSQQNAYKTLQFFVPPDAFDSRVSMAIAKILKDKYKV